MASIIKRCDCGDWDGCPHPWVVRYRTEGGRASRQREESFGDDLKEAENLLLKVEHDKKAHVFIDPDAGKALFRAEAEAWLAQRIGAESSDMTYKSVLRTHVYPVIGHRQIRTVRREEIKEIIVRMSRKGLSPSRIASARKTAFPASGSMNTCAFLSCSTLSRKFSASRRSSPKDRSRCLLVRPPSVR